MGFNPVTPYPAPAISFEDAEEKARNFAEFKGKVLVVNFWATWCPPCVAEMPLLSHIQKEWGDKGLVVLAISEDRAMQQVQAFYKKYNITNLPAYMDKDSEAFTDLGLKGLPYSLIIDRAGRVRAEIKGPEELLRFEIRKLLDTLVEE